VIPAALLNTEWVIERVANVAAKTDYGEQFPVWAELATVNMHVQDLSADERAILGSGGVNVTKRAWLNPIDGITLTEKDRVRLNVTDGMICNITHVDNPANLNHHWELELEVIYDGGTATT